MKKILLLMIIALGLLGACGKANDIKNGNIETVEARVISTNNDGTNFFTLIPINTFNGKTTTTTYIPMWHRINYLEVKYEYENKSYKTRTSDFKIAQTKEESFVKLSKEDVGKDKAAIVLYVNK